MKMTFVSKIQANLKRYQTVRTRRATNQVLDGTYKSIFKGRSMNFDELREYVQGDDVKDIDWKATARSQKMLVRQYIADRKHNIMLVLDTNRRMLGDSDGFEEKRDLAIMGTGTLAYFVNKSGDYVSATFMTNNGVKHFPFKTGLGNIELILESYYKSVSIDNNTDINDTFEYIIRNFKRKMIIIVATDVAGIRNIEEVNLKRLLVAHDVLFMNISDASFGTDDAYNLFAGNSMPSFFAKNKKMFKKTREKNLSLQREAEEKLKKFGISCSTIDYTAEIDREIINLLEKHKYDRG